MHASGLDIFLVCMQGFDEYMNLVLDEAEEVSMKRKSRKALGAPAIWASQLVGFGCNAVVSTGACHAQDASSSRGTTSRSCRPRMPSSMLLALSPAACMVSVCWRSLIIVMWVRRLHPVSIWSNAVGGRGGACWALRRGVEHGAIVNFAA